MKYIIAVLLVLSLLPAHSEANTATLIDFIIANNPELQEIKTINKNIFRLLKIEARSGVAYGQLTREGTSTLDRSQARYDIGIFATLPLISPGESAQRRIEEAQKERTLRLEVAELIKTYRSEQKAIAEEYEILQGRHKELDWIIKRVGSGVDHQKDYNQKQHDYLAKKKEYEIKKVEVDLILEKILAFVYYEKREKLKGLLHGKDVSKN
jgi:hypothetical protein